MPTATPAATGPGPVLVESRAYAKTHIVPSKTAADFHLGVDV
jgi:hypothetical protein